MDMAKALGFIFGSPGGLYLTGLYIDFEKQELSLLVLIKILIAIILFVVAYFCFKESHDIACRIDRQFKKARSQK